MSYGMGTTDASEGVTTRRVKTPKVWDFIPDDEPVRKRKKVDSKATSSSSAAKHLQQQHPPMTAAPTQKKKEAVKRGFTPADDSLLVEAMLVLNDPSQVHNNIKFSSKFTQADIEERFFNLLYAPETSEVVEQNRALMAKDDNASKRMVQTNWTDFEEDAIRMALHPTLFKSSDAISALLLQREKFLHIRSAKSLEAHFRRMKKAKTFESAGISGLLPFHVTGFDDDLLSALNADSIAPQEQWLRLAATAATTTIAASSQETPAQSTGTGTGNTTSTTATATATGASTGTSKPTPRAKPSGSFAAAVSEVLSNLASKETLKEVRLGRIPFANTALGESDAVRSRGQKADARWHDKRAEFARYMALEEEVDKERQKSWPTNTLAMLRGTKLRYCIVGSPVLLGRIVPSTAEGDETSSLVDVDLSIEGQNRTISRHQAYILFSDTAVFELHNIGRCPMIVNGRPVLFGGRSVLPHNALIEIAGLTFVFEINLRLQALIRSDFASELLALQSSIGIGGGAAAASAAALPGATSIGIAATATSMDTTGDVAADDLGDLDDNDNDIGGGDEDDDGREDDEGNDEEDDDEGANDEEEQESDNVEE